MANNRIQIKRTSVSGREANTTTLTNPGELAINMTDGIMYSTNGTVVFAIGANLINQSVTGNLTVKAIIANGSIGTAGQVLHSNGTAVYWDTDDSGGAGSVNTAAQYAWTNTHTFAANVAVGTTNTTAYTFNVNGSFAATTKSFVIVHPTKKGMTLRYGSLEGPENGVYVRGKLEGQSIIELPDYWWNLVDQDTITVNLTPYGRTQDLWVQSTSTHFIHLNQPADCFFTIFAERKDVDKLVVEF